MAERLLEQVAADIADGKAVNWDLLDSRASDPDERERLKWLRILGNIANLHRPDRDPLDESRGGLDETAGDESESGAALSAPAARTWGRFSVLEKVGEGGFGAVYRAWDPQLEREIAIKILHPYIAGTALAERLLREGRALAKIRHPNVVSVLGVEAHGGEIGLCMDFVRGQTLDDVLKTHGTLSAGEAVLIGQDVCRALAAVHRAGLVHRDVKARNVMREQAGRIVLMDFGAGRDAQTLETAPGRDMIGTPLYMAPEVLEGQPASARSDVYSLGVLLYHLVTGQYPVEAPTLDGLLTAHRQGRRRFVSEARPDLPSPFVRVMERALSFNADERHPNAGAFLDALGGISSEAKQAAPGAIHPIAAAGLAIASAAAAVMAMGFLTSAAFNVTLERSEFSGESIRDWWLWGLRAHVAPAFILTLGCIATALCLVGARLALGLSTSALRLQSRISTSTAYWVHRLSLDDASVLGSWVLLLSATGLVAVWWYFSPLLVALSTRVSMATLETHALLSPTFEHYQDRYWQILSCLVTLTGFGWYGVLRTALSAGQSVNRGIVAGGSAVLVLALGSLDFPYRLLGHNKFETVNWKGAECYMIGERPADALLFCPTLPPPRNRVVSKGAGGFERLGRRENIFTQAGGSMAAGSRVSSRP
jgi:serine/threonine-protein kinase